MQMRLSILLLAAKLCCNTLNVVAQSPADPRPPGLYSYVPGTTSATVPKSTWRAEGEQIIIDYTLNNPANEAVAVRPVFRSKTRPDFRLDPKTVSGAMGTSVVNGTANHAVWQFKQDTPKGLAKDEYFFDFDITLTEAKLEAPSGTSLYTVVTRTQSFIVACPLNEKGKGLLVVKGAKLSTKPSEVVTGDSILQLISNNALQMVFKKDGSPRKGATNGYYKSCGELGSYFNGDLYLGDINENAQGKWLHRGNIGICVRRNGSIVYLGRQEGL